MAGGLLSASAWAAPQSGSPKPNIVIIFADDLGYGDLGVYGHPTIRTPNLDRMAAEGMRFTQFYSAAPVCSPSRAALLTGRLPMRSGVSRVLNPFSEGGIPDHELTLGEFLKQAGYTTACVGKWHLGHLPKYLPRQHGFDSYFGIPYSNDMSPTTTANPNYKVKAPPTPLIRNEETIEHEPDQSQITRRYTEEAISFIRKSHADKKPFFLYLPHTFPHVPLFASERFRGKSARGLYGDVVEELDWSTGEILKTIKELGIDNNTVVFFSSDNGPWLIKKQEAGSAGLLREGKTSTWEGGMREPFIARWPGKIPAGVVTQAFGTLMDLMPTCARLAGVKLPADRVYDGVDISDVLLKNAPGREPLLFYYLNEDLRAVRKGRWKLHVLSSSPTLGGQLEKHDPPLLYDLLEDPSEKYDVSDSHPAIVRDLLDTLAKHKAELKPGPPQR